jgi:hypothetical protein
MDNSNHFKMNRSGRSGSIIFQKGNNKLEIYWEMSGSSEFDILLAPLDLKEWDEPKGVKIPLEQQLQLLQGLRSWAKKKKMRTDIDLPNDISTEDKPCGWVKCNRNRLKDSAYCNRHYDENLLRK